MNIEDTSKRTEIDLEEFERREDVRRAEFEAGMAEVRETGSRGGQAVSDRSKAQRRENLSLLSVEDLVELVVAPCKACKQRQLDLFKLADHPSNKLVWEITLGDFDAPFVPTEKFLEAVNDALHNALAAELDAHGYDHSALRYVIDVE